MGSGQQQGAEGYKRGNLKRQLDSIPVFELSAGRAGNPEGLTLTQQLWLTGLNGNLKVLVSCGIQSPDFTSQPFPWPTGGGTLQLYPVTKFGDALKVFLRPVFQDPTVVTNTNAPLAQELPYGWEASFTEVDDVLIEVTLDTAAWATANVSGTVTVQVAVEYNGAWWDIAAIEYVMGQVQLQGIGEPLVVGTAGE